MNGKSLFGVVLAVAVFVLMLFGLPDTFSEEAKRMTAIVSFGVILWIFESVPIGLTAIIVLLLMLLFDVGGPELVYSGFASPAVFLIIGGMMIAGAVNRTTLVKRVTYHILHRWGTTSRGLVGSLIIIQQIQAIFIPTTAVRSTLILPVASMMIDTIGAKRDSNLRKLIALGATFGGNISGTAILTAAIGNILTVELVKQFTGVNITYFQWFLYTFPIWLLLVPSIWFLLLKLYPLPTDQRVFPSVQEEMRKKLEELGPLNREEIRCLVILLFIVGLWVTEPLHGFHPSIPALAGAVLMTLPGIGVAHWEDVIKINFGTVLLLGVTLSMGYALTESGAATTISRYLSAEWFLAIMREPLLAIAVVILLAQIFHKVISNVSTAVVTFIPIMVSVAVNAGADPVVIGFTAGLASLHGFMLIVETMPNLLAHGTGLITQRDLLKPGFFATLLSMVIMLIVAATWWKVIGFL
ncbi:DASS family sodium-coupled anion symporter [Chungangia koreensis]|uniref:Sodium-dependent dicarboxylate transporter SdcS n=2 Tax=Chungangia koreensis TaxID=752657 RepID=A0ABV8X5S7_9LACT